jgi:hypothetical protein
MTQEQARKLETWARCEYGPGLEIHACRSTRDDAFIVVLELRTRNTIEVVREFRRSALLAAYERMWGAELPPL